MISKRTKGMPWYDVVALIIVFFIISAIFLAAVHGFAPNSGLAKGLHDAGTQIAVFLRWIAAFFQMAANWFAGW